ncbi:MAG: hypothetical protein LBC67_05655 [Spirochaetales bacterium]|nr:hypothetical protein [Spirochaetales bacterium]
MNKSFITLLCVFFTAAGSLWAQITDREEAPETIFETNIGDADVELLLSGFWDASARGAVGLAYIPGLGWSFPYVFPEFSDGFEYDQKPDLVMSLWLKERFYFETMITEDYELNSYLLGYKGKGGEFLQSLKLGNRDVEISPFAYMEFPGSSRRSPALSAMFQTQNTTHEFLLRYDPSLPHKKTFIGKNEVEEARIGPASYIRGRFFILPDVNADFLRLYIEDVQGEVSDATGRRYRRATSFDYAYNALDGSVTLTNASAGRVLAYYEKGGLPVGSSGLGKDALPAYTTGPPLRIDSSPWATPLDFDWFQPPYMGDSLTKYRVGIEGRDALLLYEPGGWNPFELTGVYSLSGTAASLINQTSLKIVRRGTDSLYGGASQSLTLSISEAYSVLRVLPSAGGSERTMLARFPFAQEEGFLYGPDRLPDGGNPDFEILVQSYVPLQSYSLATDLIPGSVTVFRNGKEESSFSVDYAEGRLVLPFEAAPSDRIEVYYRTYSGEGEGGDIIFGSGSTFFFSEELTLKLATGLRWNVMKGKYSTQPGDHPGVAAASAELRYSGEAFRMTADGAMIYTNPDTSGLLRLLGMEKHDMTLDISRNNMFPSAVPVPDPARLSPLDSLTNANRGRLLFKNYESKNAAGSVTLNSWTWQLPSSQSYAYEEGSKIGPYAASAPEANFDEVMALDFEMSAAQEWAGGQINLATGWADALDLSNVAALHFPYRVVNPASGSFQGSVSLHFQVGALSEDLDGDGVLDEEAGPSSRGYAFNDSGNVLTLYVGGGQEGFGNGIRDSEDANRNRILERENPELVVSSQAGGVFSGPGSWQLAAIPISAQDRNRLAQVRAIRFIVKKDISGAGNPARGRILIGDVTFEGSSLSPRISGAGSLRIREIPESLGLPPSGPALQNAYKDPLQTFHSNFADQRVLEASWQNMNTSDSWEIRSFTTEVPSSDYQRLNLFLRIAQFDTASALPPDTFLTLAYTDTEGKGIRLRFPVAPAQADNVWKRLSIDIRGKRAYFGSDEVSRYGGLSIDIQSADLSRFSLSLENSGGADGGLLYVDELYLSEPNDAVAFAGSADMSLFLAGDVVSLGSLPVLRNLSVTEKISGRTSEFRQEQREDFTQGKFSSASSASGEFFGLVLAGGEFALNALTERTEIEGGHSLRFPPEEGVFVLRDQYKRNYNTLLPAMSRANSVEAFLAPLTLKASSETYLASGTLFQSWETGGSLSFSESSSFSAGVSLRQTGDGYTLDEDASYGDSWLDAYRLLFPWAEGRNKERQAAYRFEGSLNGETIGLILSPEAGFINTGERDSKQRDISTLSVEIPLVFRTNAYEPGWRLSFLYSRRADTTQAVDSGGNFTEDSRALGERLVKQRFFYNSTPFAEIFSSSRKSSFAEDTAGLSRAEYVSEAGLRYSRTAGSWLGDLVLPSRAEAKAKKTFTRGGEILSAADGWEFSLTHFALNLFGLRGAYPVFSSYELDEFQFQHTLSIITKEGEKDSNWTASFHQIVNLSGPEGGGRFQLEHTVTFMHKLEEYSYKGAGEVKYIWTSQWSRDFGIGYLKRSREAARLYEHTEKLKVSYTRDRGLTAYVTAGHETALPLPKSGFIKLGFDVGFGVEKDYSGLPPGYKILLALGGGISAHFVF